MQKFQNEDLQKLIDEKYNSFTIEEKKQLYNIYSNSNLDIDDLAQKAKLLIFKEIPPTGAEFLDASTGWLPPSVVDSIYPHVKQDFLNIIDGKKEYFQLCFYGGTRLGKTFLARLLIIYTIIFIHFLREPSLFFHLSPLTDLCLYLLSWKFDKTRQLYCKPIFKILEKSDRFIQVKFADSVSIEQKKYGCKKIVYSKASSVGEITLASGLLLLLGNDDPNEILGADILQVYISEIAFFIDVAGTSEEEIFRLYTDALDRIEATVGKAYLTYVYLDSSANYAASTIESHIIKKLQFDNETYFRWRARWEARPHMFPIWNETKETFRVITGDGSIPAQIVISEEQIKNIPPDLIQDVPIDARKRYEQALVKSIKDIGGRPTSSESKFIQQASFINSIFDNETLKNVLTSLRADANEVPEGLIWNQISEQFFKKSFDGKYYFYRAPKEARCIGLDSSFSKDGDAFGLAMLHKEWSREKKTSIYVIDFCFGILPKEKAINMEAISQFIIDIQQKGNTYIKNVFSDSFQVAEGIKQQIERRGINVIKQTVDRTMNPYQTMLTCMANNELKSGRNIYLKNNLYCLQMVEGKIDHPKGTVIHDYNGDWETSQVGINAKDISDAVCQALWGAKNIDYIPSCCYEDENDRLTGRSETQQNSIKDAVKQFHEFF